MKKHRDSKETSVQYYDDNSFFKIKFRKERIALDLDCNIKLIGAKLNTTWLISNVSQSGLLVIPNRLPHNLNHQSIVEVEVADLKFLAKVIRFDQHQVGLRIIQMDYTAERKWNQLVNAKDSQSTFQQASS